MLAQQADLINDSSDDEQKSNGSSDSGSDKSDDE